MALITLADGSQLDLTAEELVLYLKATGNYAAPKTDAERIAERMVELRKEETAEAAKSAVNSHPTPAVMPTHAAPTVKPRGPVELPVSREEYKIFEVLVKHPHGITSKEIAKILDIPLSKVSGHLSTMFGDTRGPYIGTKRRWFLRDWARKAKIRIEHYPNTHWPPKEGIPS